MDILSQLVALKEEEEEERRREMISQLLQAQRSSQRPGERLLAPSGSAAYGEARPAVNPRMQAMASGLEGFSRNNPYLSMVLPVDSLANWARKSAYGEAGWSDRIEAGMDVSRNPFITAADVVGSWWSGDEQ